MEERNGKEKRMQWQRNGMPPQMEEMEPEQKQQQEMNQHRGDGGVEDGRRKIQSIELAESGGGNDAISMTTIFDSSAISNNNKVRDSRAEPISAGGDGGRRQKANFQKRQMSPINFPLRGLAYTQSALADACAGHATVIRLIGLAALIIGWHAFVVMAALNSLERVTPLLVLTSIGWTLFIYYRLLSRPLRVFGQSFGPLAQKLWRRILFRMAVYLTVLVVIVAFLALDTAKSRHRLHGLCGMAFYFVFMILFSNSPAQIVWRPVLWGFFLQFCMGLTVLRWEWGSRQFNAFSDLVLTFLDFTKNGTDFVYGFVSAPPNICGMDPVFAFNTVQVVVYFGAVVALLYHFGIMQWVIKSMAWLVQITLNTTATESLNACACIFLGQSEAPLLIRPYLDKMTASELHAVMTTGFSCIAGAVFATYISFGACPRYLLSATVMSAPGSLACSKMLYPECEQSQLVSIQDLELPAGEESNALECISNGAIMAVELVLAIIANLIVFLALLALLDAVLAWMGELVGQQGWSFELVLGYLFFPLAYLMGVTDPGETFRVAQLMGTKTALNEFIAYKQLGQMVIRGQLSPRSAMIATYALCGFSNFTSIGIQLGILGGMAPNRKRLLSRLALRALLAGSISCFMTASLAGVLIDQPIACHPRHRSADNCFDPKIAYEFLQNISPRQTRSFAPPIGPSFNGEL